MFTVCKNFTCQYLFLLQYVLLIAIARDFQSSFNQCIALFCSMPWVRRDLLLKVGMRFHRIHYPLSVIKGRLWVLLTPCSVTFSRIKTCPCRLTLKTSSFSTNSLIPCSHESNIHYFLNKHLIFNEYSLVVKHSFQVLKIEFLKLLLVASNMNNCNKYL